MKKVSDHGITWIIYVQNSRMDKIYIKKKLYYICMYTAY